MKKTYSISINGQKAVDAGRAFCRGACYRGVYNHGKRIGQLEVVVDGPGEYNGYANKWVDISYIESQKSVETVKKLLPKIGFSGCYAVVMLEQENGCIINQIEIDDFVVA